MFNNLSLLIEQIDNTLQGRLMKNVVITALLIFNFVTATTFAQNFQPQGIEVSGKASVSVVPDVYSLSFSIEKRGKSASKIKALVDQKTDQVIRAIKKLGISTNNIQTAQINLRPIYNKGSIKLLGLDAQEKFANDKKGRAYLKQETEKNSIKIAAFEVTRYINIKLTRIDDYDRLLEQLVKIGVTKISPLSMSIAEPSKHYQKALAQAVQVAHQKALKLAAQAGVTLGKVRYLKENSYNAPIERVRMTSLRSQSYHSSQVSSQEISAEVIITYRIN